MILGRDLDLAILDQRALRGGPADVEDNEVRLADLLAHVGGSEDAAGRTGFNHRNRVCLCSLGRSDTAIRLHHVQGLVVAGVLKARLKPLDVALGDRMHICRENGCIRPLIFAPFAAYFV